MNDWVVPQLRWDDSYKPDRSKVLSPEQLDEIKAFYRYLDTDGDHIAARTLPGLHPKGAYFIRGSGHNKFGQYTEEADEYVEVVDRIAKKIDSVSAGSLCPARERLSRGDIISVIWPNQPLDSSPRSGHKCRSGMLWRWSMADISDCDQPADGRQ